MTDATSSTAQDTIEIARRKLQTLALNPLVDEAFKQYEETVTTLQRELVEARADAEVLAEANEQLVKYPYNYIVQLRVQLDAQARELEAAQDEVRTLKLLNDTVEQDLQGYQSRLADAERRLGAIRDAHVHALPKPGCAICVALDTLEQGKP